MTSAKIKVAGMHCPSCEILIQDVLSDVGVSAKADYSKDELTVDFNEKKIDIKKIKKLIETEAGYKVIG